MTGKEIDFEGEEDAETSTPSGTIIVAIDWERGKGKRGKERNEAPKLQCLNYTRYTLSHLAYKNFHEIFAVRGCHEVLGLAKTSELQRKKEKYDGRWFWFVFE